MRPRIGLSVMLLESRREAIIDLATEGDRLGYDGFFMPEAWGYDMTVLLAEAAVRTTRITLGTGIVGIWNRSAATVAMAAATLHVISSGRFVLGLGASTPQLVEGLHDTPFQSPVSRMRRMVTQIRELLRGERIPLAVTSNARALKLNVPPAPALRIHIAALGDAMTRLTGELADGWAPLPISVVLARRRRRAPPRGREAGRPSGSPSGDSPFRADRRGRHGREGT
jgi:alkanesulfonate monooxygenase SsuD/methylene tetrahydromethanopterin reductase-like flavin-dependent oxidoreductase (luciferase family)